MSIILSSDKRRLRDINYIPAVKLLIRPEFEQIEKRTDGVKVKVASNPHPMEEKHYIQWIEIIDGDTSCHNYIKPDEAPEAVFAGAPENATAREYCTIHGVCGNHKLTQRADRDALSARTSFC